VLLKYNFDGIEFSDTSDQPDPRDVYIGGYGWDPGYATISKELRKFVNGEVDALDIQHYVRTHKLREDQ
jgi:hypothetical protein